MLHKNTFTPNEVTIAVFTGTHIVVGSLSIGEQRVSDVINVDIADSPFLMLKNVKITAATGKDEPKVAEFAYVNKEDIAFVVPVEEDKPKTGGTKMTYVEKEKHLVEFIIPPYEVKGYVHLLKAMNVHDVQVFLKNRFVPLTNAEARRLSSRDVSIANPVIFVNRSRAEIFVTR